MRSASSFPPWCCAKAVLLLPKSKPVAKYSIRFVIFIAAICSACNLSGQKTIINGTVFDKATGEVLPFVNVAFQNSKIGAVCDVNGAYSISTYYATDTLVASYVGYKKAKVRVQKDKNQIINFHLEGMEIEMPEMVVKYKGNPADIIFERILENKAANNKEKFSGYEYEVYNKDVSKNGVMTFK